ncbi:MAG: methylmalonyl Co-A mutase-associated GTPase MeaB [Bacteroidota bacterium]
MNQPENLSAQIQSGNFKALARAISLVENDSEAGHQLLHQLKSNHNIPVIGFTGPPGAGKSSLVNSLLKKLSAEGKKIVVVAIDPTSPFNFGSLLGDRIRLSEHFNDENIFIRSLATRGALGGLTDKIIEVIDVLRASVFDYIIIETVGVGQSEVEIAGLADTTIVVLVPEAGDEVQTMKAGLMEIADIFVVNKVDRDSADRFAKNISLLVHEKEKSDWTIPVVKTIALKNEGTDELIEQIQNHLSSPHQNERKVLLMADKAMQLIIKEKTKHINRVELLGDLKKEMQNKNFNLYQFVQSKLKNI